MTAEIERLFGVGGKVVLVTGGSSGIGFGIAESLVRGGARVYLVARKAEPCEEAAAELGELGECVALATDVATAAGRAEIAERLVEREEGLDVLVNNAGTNWAAPLADYPEAGWDKTFGLNVKAAFFLVQALLPLLEASARPEDPARVINVGSRDALRIPQYETYAYTSSKAAVHHLSRHLAARLAPRSITVNTIAPGLFPSRMLAETIDRVGEESLLAEVPLGRFADRLDLAGAAIFLASRAGSYVTGAEILVDGGTVVGTRP